MKRIRVQHSMLKGVDVKKTSKWEKRGGSYILKEIDVEKDMQRMFGSFKMAASKSKSYNADEKLYIEGIANANIVDRTDERLEPLGCDFTSYSKNSQLLAHHSYGSPIGQVDELDIREDGVHFLGWVGNPAKGPLTDMQREIRSLIAQGILKTVSIGFIPKKIRPPAYDNNGELVEPWVIEEWELLELSVVSVPANQDSIFEMKALSSTNKNVTLENEGSDMGKSVKRKGVAEILADMVKEDMCAHKLVFDGAKYDKDSACEWAKSYELKADDVLVAEDTIILMQKPIDKFADDSIKEIELEEGVKLFAGTAKADGEPDPSEDPDQVDDSADESKAAQWRKESMMLIKNVDASNKRIEDMLKTIIEALDAKINENENENENDDETDDGSKSQEAINAKTIEKRIDSLEKTIDKVVRAVQILAER